MLAQDCLRTHGWKTIRFDAAFDVNKCLNQKKFPNSISTCASYTKLPSNISAMGKHDAVLLGSKSFFLVGIGARKHGSIIFRYIYEHEKEKNHISVFCFLNFFFLSNYLVRCCMTFFVLCFNS